jgi:protein-tyrosine phosphatase/membrane-associated phospholipid phosphatase
VGVTERRPWRRALVWLVLLGPFFFASYGFANWLASRRADVPAIAFEWERFIPFLPWTIVPYWSIDLLYGLSLFICTTRREVDRHAQRLFAVQLISVAFFIAFPLRFSFDRPQTDGMFGALFTALGSFDKPFNQAPSLHIALLVLIWVILANHAPRMMRLLIHAWMALIGVSVLTTYQHHFIDIPTGLLAGFLVLWALPVDSPSPLSNLRLTADPARRRLAVRYAAGALLFAALSFPGGWFLWSLWPAISLALVSLIYAAIGARGFQKRADGRLSVAATALLLPYLAGAWINSRAWTRRHPHPAQVADGVWIGRIPTGRELRESAANGVVDLSAELPFSGTAAFYRSVPVLDLTVAGEQALREAAEAIEEARRGGTVLVCCALGYSRSAAAVVAWLLMTRRAQSVEEAMRIVREARPFVVLHSEHSAALQAFA